MNGSLKLNVEKLYSRLRKSKFEVLRSKDRYQVLIPCGKKAYISYVLTPCGTAETKVEADGYVAPQIRVATVLLLLLLWVVPVVLAPLFYRWHKSASRKRSEQYLHSFTEFILAHQPSRISNDAA